MNPRDSTHDLDYLLSSVVRATTDIRDENLRLKAENQRLEKMLAQMMPELKMLREERLALKAAVRVLTLQREILPPSKDREPPAFATLPYEILEPIFHFAAEPRYQADPSVQVGSYSPWLRMMRMKKGFPLICRATFWPGMAALYRDIVIRRMGQVSALADTLRTADVRAGLGKLIKSIRWDSCIVAAPCADVIREDMAFIFSQCTQLQSFSYHPHNAFPLRCQIPDRDECEGFFNPLWFVAMPASLSDPPLLQTGGISSLRILDLSVSLENDGDVMLLAIHRILLELKGLESLILGSWPSDSSFPEEIMRIPKVSLPFLSDLRIFAPEGPVDTYLCSRWEAPNLTRLTVFISTGRENPTRLLERFGIRLRYFHLYPHRSSVFLPTLTSMLSTVCPLLEHLVMPYSTDLEVNSLTLTHLDFWTDFWALESRQDSSQAVAYRSWTVAAQSNAPSLRTVRVIFGSRSLVGNRAHSMSSPDWPWICHPRLLAEGSDDVLYHRFPLGRVAQTVAALVPEDLWQRSLGEECFDPGEDWPGVYGDLDELEQRIKEECRDSDRRLEGREGGDEGTTSSSDWTSDDSSSEEEDDGDSRPNGPDAAIGENVERTSELNEIQDDARRLIDLPEGRERSQEREKGEGEEERDGRLGRRQLEAAAELVSSPEYPVTQLDRTTILAAFRRGRSGEDYYRDHVDIWDQ